MAESRCPKCGEARAPERDTCTKCGLAVERMAAYAEAHEATAGEDLRAAWDRALADWDTPVRHDEIMQLVARHGSYAWAAGRYRDAAHDAKHETVARRQLDRLQRAAEATLFASATARPDRAAPPYRATMTILALMILAIVVGLAYALFNQPETDADPPDTVLRPAVRVAPGSQTR